MLFAPEATTLGVATCYRPSDRDSIFKATFYRAWATVGV
jgi:hypothetical protein